MDMDIYSEETNLRLDERQLAEQLQISRTPIREALARLEREGFVEIRPRKGVFVRPKTLPEVLEIVVVWAALESMAARLVTKVATDKEISTLRILGVKHSSDSNRADLEEYSEANIKFHQRILSYPVLHWVDLWLLRSRVVSQATVTPTLSIKREKK